VQSIIASVSTVPRCSAKTSAASTSPKLLLKRRARVLTRSLGYRSEPSVAIVISASFSPSSRSLAVLIAAIVLQMT